MKHIDTEIAVIGSGFAGSILAMILQRIGYDPVLIERGSHPRFAIGESSTPMANLILADLAERYDLPELVPLCNYGSWCRAFPKLPVGLKRGFAYFQHRASQPFEAAVDHPNELLVAATPDAERGDTQWLRANFDNFLVGLAQSKGITYLDQTELQQLDAGPPWSLSGHRLQEELRITARFVVDASGPGNVLSRTLSIDDDGEAMHINTRSIYGHFTGVDLWHDVFVELGGHANDHPFTCDDSALHHIFDGGWMWVLRFDNGVTSAGFVLDQKCFPLDETVSPDDEWSMLLKRFPSLAEQFAGAQPTIPIIRTGRLQRRATRATGSNWAMLPSAACFVDPLHSNGNAHTLSGIERLAHILEDKNESDVRTDRLAAYGRALRQEANVLDQIIHACSVSFGRFDLFASATMLYFAAATVSELRRRADEAKIEDGFLLADRAEFREIVGWAHEQLERFSSKQPHQTALDGFQAELARRLEPFNLVGLCDPAKQNMYAYP